MNYPCPKCNHDKTEPLPAAFRVELANFTPARVTLGDLIRDMLGIEQKGAPETLLQRVAPPQKRLYFPILAIWFLTTLAVTLVKTVEGTLAGYVVLFAAGCGLLKVYKFNTNMWPLLFERWEHSYVCKNCGAIFQLHQH